MLLIFILLQLYSIFLHNGNHGSIYVVLKFNLIHLLTCSASTTLLLPQFPLDCAYEYDHTMATMNIIMGTMIDLHLFLFVMVYFERSLCLESSAFFSFKIE